MIYLTMHCRSIVKKIYKIIYSLKQAKVLWQIKQQYVIISELKETLKSKDKVLIHNKQVKHGSNKCRVALWRQRQKQDPQKNEIYKMN